MQDDFEALKAAIVKAARPSEQRGGALDRAGTMDPAQDIGAIAASSNANDLVQNAEVDSSGHQHALAGQIRSLVCSSDGKDAYSILFAA